MLRMGSLPIAVNFVDIEGLPFSRLRLDCRSARSFQVDHQSRISAATIFASSPGVALWRLPQGVEIRRTRRIVGLQGIGQKVAATQRATFRSSMPDERWSARCGRPFSHLRLRRRYFLRTRGFGRSTASRPPTASAGVPAWARTTAAKCACRKNANPSPNAITPSLALSSVVAQPCGRKRRALACRHLVPRPRRFMGGAPAKNLRDELC